MSEVNVYRVRVMTAEPDGYCLDECNNFIGTAEDLGDHMRFIAAEYAFNEEFDCDIVGPDEVSEYGTTIEYVVDLVEDHGIFTKIIAEPVYNS